ncbi:conserved hypothetical protein [Ricinus communis]|uniref:Reverse transcriptase zinc-binding domain-containing protein n=1 Tax=Ricinus communis TaxID=3988 RepID=B9RQ38_RICCO|nr:conserved hypothetical protein [Ricinus communis]
MTQGGREMRKSFCGNMNTQIARFWWESCKEKEGIKWERWAHMMKSKYLGGCGFKDFDLFNQAMLAKQVWRAIRIPNALWVRLIRGKYISNGDILKARKVIMRGRFA